MRELLQWYGVGLVVYLCAVPVGCGLACCWNRSERFKQQAQRSAGIHLVFMLAWPLFVLFWLGAGVVWLLRHATRPRRQIEWAFIVTGGAPFTREQHEAIWRAAQAAPRKRRWWWRR